MTGVIHKATWALFCRVIDNHGDLGVCWRLAVQLAGRGMSVQLYVDDDRALRWMAPLGCAGVSVVSWPAEDEVFTPEQVPGVVIEALGCELPAAYQAAMAARPAAPVWVNLEYFSLEPVAQRNHGLPSPVLSGPAKGMRKWFYYPGWGENSGGLLSGFLSGDLEGLSKPERLVAPGKAGKPAANSQAPLGGALNNPAGHPPETAADTLGPDNGERSGAKPLQISMFCYEPAGLGLWLAQLARLPQGVHLHVTAGRAAAALRLAMQATDASGLSLDFLDYLSQPDYDALLARMDLNLVRGEDSLVRAMWAGKPLLWNIYPQHDGAHLPKLHAFLQQTGAPPVVVQAHLAWNADKPVEMPALTTALMAEWSAWAKHIQEELTRQSGLTERLMAFVAVKG